MENIVTGKRKLLNIPKIIRIIKIIKRYYIKKNVLKSLLDKAQ